MSAQSFGRYLTRAEERQLLGHVGQYANILARRDHAWMLLARHTGIRVGTLAALTVSDAAHAIDSGELVVRDEAAKRGAGYSVRVNKLALAALTRLLAIRREMGHRPEVDAPLVMSMRQRGLSVRSFQARMRYWVQDARLPVPATPHWFRHTLAMRLLRSAQHADPLGLVQLALGHRRRDTTTIYARPTREELADALEAAAC